MTVDELTPHEIAAALAARRELGPEYEHEIAASLADKVQRRIEESAASAASAAASAAAATRDEIAAADSVTARWTALGSLTAGTAITICCSGPNSTPAVVPVAWAGIMVINVAVNLGRRRRRTRG
jgi:phage protein D